MHIFIELSVVLVVAALFAFVCRALKQPPIVGYILTGIVLGPYGFSVSNSIEILDLFSKIGVTVLLFIVGLNLSPRILTEVGKVSLFTGIGQIALTSVAGFLLLRFLGYAPVAAGYAALALTFSSTIIIIKLLSDKGDIHALYGKLAIGILLVQDIVASFVLVFMGSGSGEVLGIGGTLALMGVKATLVIVAMYLLSQRLVNRLGLYTAKSQELLFLFSIAWGLGFATLFYLLGFSVEIGALIAGVLLSLTPYALEISSRLRPLRDFFIILFFIALGRSMTFGGQGDIMAHIAIMSLFVLIGNPLIMYVIMNVCGYTSRTSFLTGVTLGQVSEFSFIMIALAHQLGLVPPEIVSLVTAVGVITIAGSTYFILYAHKLYPRVEPVLSLFSLSPAAAGKRPEAFREEVYDTILFGYNRVGKDFVNAFIQSQRSYLVVDFNPEAIQRLEAEAYPHRYGDAQDTEFLQELGFTHTKLVVSTMPDFEANKILVRFIRTRNRNTNIIVLSHDAHEAQELYEEGASYVMMPHYLGAQYAARMIVKHTGDPDIFTKEREKHQTFILKAYASTST